MNFNCHVCGMTLKNGEVFQTHLKRCVERNGDYLDALRPRQPFEGDPELAAFARAEGSVYNRRPGTRRQPR